MFASASLWQPMGEFFNTIYTTWYRKSFLFVKSYVHDDAVAEDIVSDALIKLWNRMKAEHISDVAPLLFTMLKNGALDYLRHETIRRAAHDQISKAATREIEIRLNTLQSCDPQEIFSEEVTRIVQETLSALPVKTRRVFEMSRIEGIPYKEIAESMGITVKGIDYHVSRTVQKLRKALKDYLPFWLTILN